jgi:hypothetical protein
MRARRNTPRVFVGKQEGKRPLGRHWHTWENNIKIDLKRNRVRRYGLNASGCR